MDVVRHDHVFVQHVALAVEEAQRAADDSSAVRITQHTGTAARVEELFVAFREERVILGMVRGRERLQVVKPPPLFALSLHFLNDSARQGIGQTEGNKIPDSALLPVRQISAITNVDFRKRIKVLPQSSGSILLPIL
jgi:hypothetical protein